MDKWSYIELQEFIHEDLHEFMDDGLNIRQACSRIQVEYAKSIKDSELEKLIIYMVLCEESIQHGFLPNDIKEETLALLVGIDLEEWEQQLNYEQWRILKEDMNRISALLM